MNLLSEQINIENEIVIAKDQPLTIKEQHAILFEYLGNNNCCIESINKKKVFVYKKPQGKKIILLTKAITYLGGNGQHPIYKKRMQLPKWYKEFCSNIGNNSNYEVIFLGIYHFESHVIFVNFIKDTYLLKKMNNSAAHVYINDLYQSKIKGIFKKNDKFGNTIFTINSNILKNYLNDTINTADSVFEVLDRFNESFPFKQWIRADYAIDYMYVNGSSQWKQTEWAGWYLECLFDQFIKSKNLAKIIEYVGLKYKKNGELDFDLLIEEEFYGDLKASSIDSPAVLLNDQSNLIHAIETYKKFWYVIYMHSTRKDKDFDDYPMTKYRAIKINESENKSDGDFNIYSYKNKMKHSIKFQNMIVLELNKANFKHALEDFNQGVQPDGSPRKPKFKISKKNIDNFVIYRFDAR
jgi:hypothetical protein